MSWSPALSGLLDFQNPDLGLRAARSTPGYNRAGFQPSDSYAVTAETVWSTPELPNGIGHLAGILPASFKFGPKHKGITLADSSATNLKGCRESLNPF